MMLRIGFGEKLTSLIMVCVSSVSYSVLVNGQPGRVINPTRGIRQGDLMSPYLFLICAVGLSQLLNKAEEGGRIKGVFVARGGIKINHLMFADDCVVFCRAQLEEWRRIEGILCTYELALGQTINKQKLLFFSVATLRLL